VRQPTYVVFIDFKKAYDTVPHGALFAKLSHKGVRGRCLTFIRALYAGSTMRVRVGGGTQGMYSEVCRLRHGVRQGCPLSPVFFNIFIDDLPMGTEKMGVKVPVGLTRTRQISRLQIGINLFADDAAGICPTLECVERFCDHVTQWSNRNEMSIGISKCGLMEFLPNDLDFNNPLLRDFRPIEEYADLDRIQIDGQDVPIVEEYLYLGIRITPALKISKMVEHRLEAGRKTVCYRSCAALCFQ